MIIEKKSVSFKSYLIVLSICLSSLYLDSQIKNASTDIEARFLGIGNKRTEMGCILGV
jgi:hypothetical protein